MNGASLGLLFFSKTFVPAIYKSRAGATPLVKVKMFLNSSGKTVCRSNYYDLFLGIKVTGEGEPTRSASPNSQVTSSSSGVGATLAALGGLSGLLSNPLQMLGSLQAFQNPQSIQQLQQLAMLQQGHVASGNQLNPQFFLQNQVCNSILSTYS